MYKLVRIIENSLKSSNLHYCICGNVRREEPFNEKKPQKLELLVKDFSLTVKTLKDIGAKKIGVPFTSVGELYQLENLKIGVYQGENWNWGAMQLYLTGNRLFVRLLRAHAKNKYYKLNQKGVWFNGECIAGKTEKQIFDLLGIKYLPPAERCFKAGDYLPLL